MKLLKLFLSGTCLLSLFFSGCQEIVSDNLQSHSAENETKQTRASSTVIEYDIKSWNFNYNDTKGWIDGSNPKSTFRPAINAYAIESKYPQAFYKTLSSEESEISKAAEAVYLSLYVDVSKILSNAAIDLIIEYNNGYADQYGMTFIKRLKECGREFTVDGARLNQKFIKINCNSTDISSGIKKISIIRDLASCRNGSGSVNTIFINKISLVKKRTAGQ